MGHPGRVATAIVIAGTLLLSAPPRAVAAGVSDPDDTRGPLDIRSVVVRPTSQHVAKLTFTLYPGFTWRALGPRGSCCDVGRELGIEIDDFTARGFFYARRDGTIMFVFGDPGSAPCCRLFRVRQPAPTTLVVRYRSYARLRPGTTVSGYSMYRPAEATHDTTATFELGPRR